MATVTRAYSEVDGTIGQASSINRVLDDLYSTINSLNSANINDSSIGSGEIDTSAVITAKINTSAITTAKIDDGAVVNSKIASGTIAFSRLDYENILMREVF